MRFSETSTGSRISTVTYRAAPYTNVVDDTKYSIVTLCGDNGLYYDSSSNTCIRKIIIIHRIR
jgi:hypothetical protein